MNDCGAEYKQSTGNELRILGWNFAKKFHSKRKSKTNRMLLKVKFYEDLMSFWSLSIFNFTVGNSDDDNFTKSKKNKNEIVNKITWILLQKEMWKVESFHYWYFSKVLKTIMTGQKLTKYRKIPSVISMEKKIKKQLIIL